MAVPAGLHDRGGAVSRIGLKFGQLTVLDERPGALRCRCDCGREGWYLSAITKPSYKRRLRCEVCAGRPCEVCGAWINAKVGQRALTCSETCRKARASRIECERYERVKGTQHWRETRAAYLQLLKDRASGDPSFAVIYWAYQRARQRAWRARANADPARREAMLQVKREAAAVWREKLRANPEAYQAHLQAARAWYASLTPADRERIFYEPKRRRDAARAAAGEVHKSQRKS